VFTQPSRYSHPCAAFAGGDPVGSYTLAPDEALYEPLCRFASDVIAAFARQHDVPDGVTHMEMFHTSSGDLVFLEVQFRPPGANVKVSYARHLGVNLEDVHLRLQMGKTIEPVTPRGPWSAWMYFPTADGTVESLNPLPPLTSEIVEASWYVRPGQHTARPQSILDARARGVVALSLVIANEDYGRLIADFEQLTRYCPCSMASTLLRPAPAPSSTA